MIKYGRYKYWATSISSEAYTIWEYRGGDDAICVESTNRNWDVGDKYQNFVNIHSDPLGDGLEFIPIKSEKFNRLYDRLRTV